MNVLPKDDEEMPVGIYMSQNFTKVLREDRPDVRVIDEHYAVFDVLSDKGVFCGLVTKQQVIKHPYWIFSELIKHYPQAFLNMNTPVDQAMNTLLQLKIDALPVLNAEQTLMGVIRSDDLLPMLYEYQNTLLLKRDKEAIKQEKISSRLKTKLRHANTQINRLTEHDPLTGVLNFTLIQQMIQQFIDSQPNTNQLAILLLGIDNFNVINTVYGSSVGDVILQKVSDRIKRYCHEEDILARKDGDKFIVVFRNVDSVHEISRRTKQILRSLAQSFSINDLKVSITASVGISIYPVDAQNTNDLLVCASIALSQSKAMGKNHHQYFTPKMGNKVQYTHTIQTELIGALERHEFSIYYQPQVTISNRRILGVEALMRWNNPRLGLVMPDDFIPIAEAIGQIIPIGNWILHEACKQAQRWQQAGCPLQISVNVSALQFQTFNTNDKTRLIKSVQSALAASSLAPELLELELTESAIMRSDALTTRMLKKIKALGVQISCDDFGMGYSSFNRLKQLPLDTIKIDQSLIDDIHKEAIDATIVRAIITIAQQLNIKTLAEGVENIHQFNALCDMGCDFIQGYYFCKPMLPDELDTIITRGFF